MKKIKLKQNTIETLKFAVLLIVIVFAVKLIFTYIPPLNAYNMFSIQTDSMDPIIAPGDIVITKEIDPKDIEVGDIVAFHVDITGDGKDDVVVHYIAEINTVNDKLTFKTKPHVSELQDRWTLEEEDIVGIYTYQVDNLGKILQFAQSWVGITIIIIDILIISVLYDVLFKKKNDKKENNSNDVPNPDKSD